MATQDVRIRNVPIEVVAKAKSEATLQQKTLEKFLLDLIIKGLKK